VGRSLAPRGYRVVLPIPPWHGRREVPGAYTGEPYLAGMPGSAIELYATQAAEITVLTDWARSLGAPSVGVGGISLGGIVSTLVASHADTWPTDLQPNFAVLVAPSARVDDLLFDSSRTEILGVTDALQAAGWTRESMDDLGHLLRARDTAGIDPERIYPVGGLRDEMTQYQPTKTVFEEWGVPADNSVTCPAKIVHGGSDQHVPLDDAHRLSREIGDNASMKVVPRGNHMCTDTLSRNVVPYMCNWLRKTL
jgi:pimeloyl-ACP methyl ester carboxylesterase